MINIRSRFIFEEIFIYCDFVFCCYFLNKSTFLLKFRIFRFLHWPLLKLLKPSSPISFVSKHKIAYLNSTDWASPMELCSNTHNLCLRYHFWLNQSIFYTNRWKIDSSRKLYLSIYSRNPLHYYYLHEKISTQVEPIKLLPISLIQKFTAITSNMIIIFNTLILT